MVLVIVDLTVEELVFENHCMRFVCQACFVAHTQERKLRFMCTDPVVHILRAYRNAVFFCNEPRGVGLCVEAIVAGQCGDYDRKWRSVVFSDKRSENFVAMPAVVALDSAIFHFAGAFLFDVRAAAVGAGGWDFCFVEVSGFFGSRFCFCVLISHTSMVSP